MNDGPVADGVVDGVRTKVMRIKNDEQSAVHVVGEEPEEQLFARRMIAHNGATVDWYSINEQKFRGAAGGFEITVSAFVPMEIFVHDGGTTLLATDCGGWSDRTIATVARNLTGQQTAEAVSMLLLAHYVSKVDDLQKAMLLKSPEWFARRAEIAEALGLVEPPLPLWAVAGAVVVNGDGTKAKIQDVTDAGVRFFCSKERLPIGVFVKQGWRLVEESER